MTMEDNSLYDFKQLITKLSETVDMLVEKYGEVGAGYILTYV
jgi:hypothetical protein